jgi:hypothetical protein
VLAEDLVKDLEPQMNTDGNHLAELLAVPLRRFGEDELEPEHVQKRRSTGAVQDASRRRDLTLEFLVTIL